MNPLTQGRGQGMQRGDRGRSKSGIVGVLALASLVACGGGDDPQAGGRGPGGALAAGGMAERAIPVAVEVAGQTDLQVLLRASTNLRARRQVEVLPKQGGVIARILVEEGTPVRQGQPLAVLDDAEWRLQARQSTARAQAARDAMVRGEALQERGLLADQEVERLRSDAEVAAADAALAALRVENTTVLSPLAGVVTHRRVEQGQLVGTNTPAFTVADISRLEADVGIPEREAPRVGVGQPARIRIEGIGAPIEARVIRIRPVVDPTSGTVQVTVEVDPQQAAGLRAGQFVNVDIVTEVLEGRLTLPRTAVLVDGPTPRVFRVTEGRAEEVLVEVGGSHGERIEISAGVNGGDTIVVVGQDNLQPRAAVLVMEVDGVRVASPTAPEMVIRDAPDRETLERRFLDRGMSPEEARAAVDQMQQRRDASGGDDPGGGRGPGGGTGRGGAPGGGS